MNVLTLVDISPVSNPDTMICAIAISGGYVQGTGDQLPIGNILDPLAIGEIPLPGVTSNPPPVTPYLLNANVGGNYAQVKRVVTPGVGNAPATTTFFLVWYAPGGAELATQNYPAAILGAEVFLAIKVKLLTQS